jgi:hypothetical protein
MLGIKVSSVEFIVGDRNKVVKDPEVSQLLALVDLYRMQQVNTSYAQTFIYIYTQWYLG